RSGSQSDTGINHGVENVNQQIDHYDHGTAHQYNALDDREVAEGDAFIKQPADAGPGEYDFDDGRHIYHDHEVNPGQGQHWDQRVFEGMLGNHQRLGQALDARQLDIFRAEHFKHGGPRQPHMSGGEIPAKGKGRHDQMQRGASAR